MQLHCEAGGSQPADGQPRRPGGWRYVVQQLMIVGSQFLRYLIGDIRMLCWFWRQTWVSGNLRMYWCTASVVTTWPKSVGIRWSTVPIHKYRRFHEAALIGSLLPLGANGAGEGIMIWRCMMLFWKNRNGNQTWGLNHEKCTMIWTGYEWGGWFFLT